jgi:hypothetical protein
LANEKVDHVLSLLGEIEFIKTALNGLDKSIRVALSSKEIAPLVGAKGNFSALRKLEKIQAEVLLLNVDMLRIAEKLSVGPMSAEFEPEPEPQPQPDPQEKKEINTKNPVVNNVLDYLNERLRSDDE